VQVRATAQPTQNIQDGCCQIVNPAFFTRTDAQGNFNVRWRDETRQYGQIPLVITIAYISSWRAGSWMEGDLPVTPAQFRVAPFSQAVSGITSFNHTVLSLPDLPPSPDLVIPQIDLPVRRGTFRLPAGDRTAAYLTAHEVFVRATFPDLRRRMRGLMIRFGAPNDILGLELSGGVAPSAREILLTTGTPVTFPGTVAHEIGHAITWTGFDFTLAPISPIPDYGADGRWSMEQRVSSKAAFLEGLAEQFALIWEFGEDAPGDRLQHQLSERRHHPRRDDGHLFGGRAGLGDPLLQRRRPARCDRRRRQRRLQPVRGRHHSDPRSLSEELPHQWLSGRDQLQHPANQPQPQRLSQRRGARAACRAHERAAARLRAAWPCNAAGRRARSLIASQSSGRASTPSR
jgi:hypothetical protein